MGYGITTYKLVNPQKVNFSTSTQSNAISAHVDIIRLVSDVACYIEIGQNPTATTSSIYLPAGIPEYLRVPFNSKIAALAASGSGNLFIAEATT